MGRSSEIWFCFFNDTATTEIYSLSLHDALPISRELDNAGASPRPKLPRGLQARPLARARERGATVPDGRARVGALRPRDRKSTRLNSSHANTSYAVFCLKKNTNSPTSPDVFFFS